MMSFGSNSGAKKTGGRKAKGGIHGNLQAATLNDPTNCETDIIIKLMKPKSLLEM